MDAQWWKSAVVYQVYPRSFADSGGDGIGDLAGITSRLDHLAALGVDVVWLSPVYRSPHADNGYDISDYRDIDPVFGTLADFDHLIGEVHARGMKLVMDLVVNHTSDEHPWFAESRSGKDNPKRDWYVWRPPRDGHELGEPGAEPNNWSSFFSGPAWQADPATGEYYLHLFDRKQPDLNWDNPEVREAVYDMMRWWLDRGVDGFRMDVINLIAKHPDLPDAPAEPGALGDGFPYYGTLPRVHEHLREMRREVFDGREGGFLTVGEMPGVTTQQAREFTDPANHEIDMVFQFEHVSLDHGPGGKFDPVPLDLRAFKASMAAWQGELAEVGWNSLYLGNHDQPRAVSRFGDDDRWWRESATALATVLHLHRGTPYVYQGEELGMTNSPFVDAEALRDVESLNHLRQALAAGQDADAVWRGVRAMGRDNARTPVQWDGGTNGGFTTGTPWIAVNPNSSWLNAEAQRADQASVFHHYRRLIELRHTLPVVVEGTFRMLLPEHPDVYAYERVLGEERLLVVANLSGTEQPVDLDLGGEVLLANVEPVGQVLAPWQAVVLRA
ncbi:glycoside hydrolase family 13 protein [Actinosynnema mirum]|uniref:Alpha amylase catalytic region n=1 Tax=Actinosynnema mirum (strain ATCC 29888 / DSM 43827 / JCM 3225 / NBRC 14064 / NCIMB 13271 / NRRL B-12336 / IMRU 3971 / 101) TaxID=446462 RepID=C6WRT7_ACTMD|nr:alpha-glucosidase [Actinosynnema mirum]ACU36929.1 alpha amylase catalytic region [Actinosynnema mirum DSM 43827]